MTTSCCSTSMLVPPFKANYRILSLLCIALVMLSGCYAQKVATPSDRTASIDSAAFEDSSLAEIESNDIDTVVNDIVAGPIDRVKVGLTVGERLKRLDSMMLVAPADSLENLMAEYERILDSALTLKPDANQLTTKVSSSNQQPPSSLQPSEASLTSTSDKPATTSVPLASANENVKNDVSQNSSTEESAVAPIATQQSETTPATKPQSRSLEQATNQPLSIPIDSTISKSSTPRSTPRSSVRPNRSSSQNSTIVSTTTTNSTEHQSSSEKRTTSTTPNSVVVEESTRQKEERSSLNPSDYKGVRKSEMRHYRKSVASTRSSGNSSRTTGKTSTNSRTSASSNTTTTTTGSKSRTTTSSSGRPSKSSTKPSYDRLYTEGLAHFRAGEYSAAADDLSSVARSGKSSHRSTARLYWAMSLERLGRTRQANSQYRQLMRSSGATGDKAYIGYCRTLASMGQRSKARTQLLAFISSRSSSSQISQARKLLQTL